MTRHLERTVALEKTPEEDLADDVVFEPSANFQGRLVGIAIKNGHHVCWCCFAAISPRDSSDLVMGEGALVRICGKAECVQRVGEANADRSARDRANQIVRFGDLTEADRESLVEEIKRKKIEFRKH